MVARTTLRALVCGGGPDVSPRNANMSHLYPTDARGNSTAVVVVIADLFVALCVGFNNTRPLDVNVGVPVESRAISIARGGSALRFPRGSVPYTYRRESVSTARGGSPEIGTTRPAIDHPAAPLAVA